MKYAPMNYIILSSQVKELHMTASEQKSHNES